MKATRSTPIQVLLADDHAVFRAGVRLLLESAPGIHVVGEAADEAETVELSRRLSPGVIVVDPRFGGADGSESIRRIVASAPDARVLALVMTVTEDCRDIAECSGAQGCLSKLRADRELVPAVRALGSAGTYFATDEPSHGATNGVEPDRWPDRILSDRERQVVALTAEGYSSREIGERFRISSKTVDTYRARSMEKLGFSHRWELVQYALRTGLLGSH